MKNEACRLARSIFALTIGLSLLGACSDDGGGSASDVADDTSVGDTSVGDTSVGDTSVGDTSVGDTASGPDIPFGFRRGILGSPSFGADGVAMARPSSGNEIVRVYAYDGSEADGIADDETWSWSVPGGYVLGSPPTMAPGGGVYVVLEDDDLDSNDDFAPKLVALGPDGSEAWDHELAEPFGIYFAPQWFDVLGSVGLNYHAPLVIDGDVYVVDSGRTVVSLTSDGTERWSENTGSPLTPGFRGWLHPLGDGRAVLAAAGLASASDLVVVDLATGATTERSLTDLGVVTGDETPSLVDMAVGASGVVYLRTILTGDMAQVRVAALNLSDDSVAWTTELRLEAADDADSNLDLVPHALGIAVDEAGGMVVLRVDDALVALDPTDGDERWTVDFTDEDDLEIYSDPAILSDGRVAIPSNDSETLVVIGTGGAIAALISDDDRLGGGSGVAVWPGVDGTVHWATTQSYLNWAAP